MMIDRRALMIGGAAATLMPTRSLAQTCVAKGHFSGNPQTEWLPEHDYMKLIHPFAYTDRCGKVWQVPVGATVNGASIPPWLWPVVGHPFDNPYRNASIVHDWYCAVRTEPWKAVALMFYEGMLASNTPEAQAKRFYYAVRFAGPSWDDLTIMNNRLITHNGEVRPAAFDTSVATAVTLMPIADPGPMPSAPPNSTAAPPYLAPLPGPMTANSSEKTTAALQRWTLDQREYSLVQAAIDAQTTLRRTEQEQRSAGVKEMTEALKAIDASSSIVAIDERADAARTAIAAIAPPNKSEQERLVVQVAMAQMDHDGAVDTSASADHEEETSP